MKSRLQLAGLTAAIATTGLQAEVKINEYFSFDGYAIGAGVVTEGTSSKDGPSFGDNGGAYDSVYVALNGKYKSFSGKISVYSFNPFDGAQSATRLDPVTGAPILDTNGNGIEDPIDNVGILDAYVTYSFGDLSITGGKYLGYLGFESFHSPNNAFISFGMSDYRSSFDTGVKLDYAGKGFSTGVSVRDSQIAGEPDGFFEGDGEFSDDVGYEAYFMFTGFEKLTLFVGAGFEDVDGGEQVLTTNAWASYAVTDKFSVAAEYAATEDSTTASGLLQATYAVTSSLSVSGRATARDGDDSTSDGVGYGLASTYTITPNFSIKGEVTMTDLNSGDDDSVSYALQGLFRF